MTIANRKGITVRFEDEEMAKLDELAARYHVSSATIIRWALKALADYVTVNDGRIVLPLDFTTFYQQAKTYPALEQVDQAEGNNPSLSTHADGAQVGNRPRVRRRKQNG